MLESLGETARCFGRRGSAHPSRVPHSGARRRFVERTTGTRPGRGRLPHPALAAVESWRLAVGPGARRAARSDEASGREVGRRACGAIAHPGWRCGVGPHSGVVVESQELLRGQKRGIAVALRKAKVELRKLERRAASGRIQREALEDRVQKALQREHLSEFVIATVKEGRGQVSLRWHVDAARRRRLERTRLGRRVLCTDRHVWSNGRIAYAFRGQWNVEELFRRAKKGGVAPWGPSHQWADSSLRLHTFATVIGLTLVSLVSLKLGTRKSAQSMMKTLSEVKATLVRVRTKERGRRATVMLAPDLTAEQRKSVKTFDLGRWMPTLLSSRTPRASAPDVRPSA